jgi:hypothetical protein
MSATTCPSCRARKGKRACPALGESICTQCCGSKRRVSIACPDDCVYLSGGHAPAWDGRETERRRDARRFAQHLQALDAGQWELFFLALNGLNALRAQRRELDDRLVFSALGALRRTLETRAKGLLYDHAPDDARAVALVRELSGLFRSRGGDGQPVEPHDKDVLAVLGALHGAADETLREQAGPTAWLDSIARLAGRLAPTESRAPSRPLILEP